MPIVELQSVNILHIIYATIALFSVLLVLGKDRYKALVMLLLFTTAQMIFNILEELDITRQFHLITPALPLATGPLYYLFTKNLIYGNIKTSKDIIHLTPAIVALAFTAWWPILMNIAFVLLTGYFFLTFRLLHHYHHVLAELISDNDKYALYWLTRTLIVIFTFEFVDFIRMNIQQELPYKLLMTWYFWGIVISLLCTSYLIVKAIRHPRVFGGLASLEKTIDESKALTHTENTEQAYSIFIGIDKHVQTTCMYQQPKLSLSNLADELGLTEKDISWAINQGGGKSFSDYVNTLRIEEIKRTIQTSPQKINLLDVALKAGFNSKSTFNVVFKRITGMTPSQYSNSYK